MYNFKLPNLLSKINKAILIEDKQKTEEGIN